MNTKLIKATVRKSGNVVYVGRCYRPRASDNRVTPIMNEKSCTRMEWKTPAVIPTSQRYMKVAFLAK